MPTYDFKCPECNETREVTIKHKEYDKYKVMCSNGHYLPMQRMYTPTAVQFKGTGFYSTGGQYNGM